MAVVRTPLFLALATLVVSGCASFDQPTEKEPIAQVPSGDLDYKPVPRRPAGLDVKNRMPKFALPATVADTRLYSFRATGQPVRLALSQLATAYKLNIVVDQDVEGLVTVDLNKLPLEKVLEAVLEPLGLAWSWQDGLLRVSRLETRTFNIDYVRLVRSGSANSTTTTSLSGSGGGGGGGSAGDTSSRVAQQDSINFWEEVEEQLEAILERSDADYGGSGVRPMETTVQTDRETNITTELTRRVRESEGRLVIDRTSGTVQVTTTRARMKNVVEFLKRVTAGIKRQVYIQAKVVEVSLSDDQSLGIDWNAIDFGSLVLSTSATIANPAGGFTALPAALTGTYVRSFSSGELDAIDGVLTALKEQGQVKVVSQPRISTLNNQSAIVRVGTERTFFTKEINEDRNDQGAVINREITYDPTTVTEGLVLTVTPQISEEGMITMDVNPVLTNIRGVDQSPDEAANAPQLDIKQTSTLVRMYDGETIVVGGLIQETVSETDRAVPVVGEVPLIGSLFSGNYDKQVRKELVIFLTPNIIQ
jgi:MSHA type pilus biogenesis protein MshL